MRVTSDLWTAAMIRQVFGRGGFAAVMRRGSSEAGAIFLVVRDREGGAQLFGPAPQSDYGEGRPEERRFARLPVTAEDAIAARLEREQRFDPDIWVVEIEPGSVPVEDLLRLTAP